MPAIMLSAQHLWTFARTSFTAKFAGGERENFHGKETSAKGGRVSSPLFTHKGIYLGFVKTFPLRAKSIT
jgi:hypothetical protein